MKRILLFLSLLLISISACQTDKDPELPVQNKDLEAEDVPETPTNSNETGITSPFAFNAVEEEIIQRNNIFAFNLLREVEADDMDKNILLSPFSASLAIGMLNNGAVGKTQTEIQQALGYANISIDELNSLYCKTDSLMTTGDKSVAFETANSIWADIHLPLLPLFKETNSTFFNAEVRNVDMQVPKTADTINQWCAGKTHDRIKKIVEENDIRNAAMLLTNALYFKGAWTYRFDEGKTQNKSFHNADRSFSVVPMMQMELTCSYAEKDNYQAVEIPYGNGTFSMLIVLPDEGVEISSLVRNMNAESWKDLQAELHSAAVNLNMPRFKVEYQRKMNDDLQALGMKAMFSDMTADFSKISSTALSVSLVLQKTFIEVNEEGTEAAAVTSVSMAFSAVNVPETLRDFIINRPFIYFIKEKKSGIIFFAGAVKML
ncbi:MAG: serpin family protein [Tannerellaceae bacterium]|jgi:serpin B|nr:serpin family protein [Tannerellaceae bacterium]